MQQGNLQNMKPTKVECKKCDTASEDMTVFLVLDKMQCTL